MSTSRILTVFGACVLVSQFANDARAEKPMMVDPSQAFSAARATAKPVLFYVFDTN